LLKTSSDRLVAKPVRSTIFLVFSLYIEKKIRFS
jgi:hypothetical protein